MSNAFETECFRAVTILSEKKKETKKNLISDLARYNLPPKLT